jgi:transposase
MNEKSVVTRGRPAKPISNPNLIIEAIIKYLQLLIGKALAKRVVAMTLIAIGIPNTRITEVTGLSDRHIWTLKKTIRDGNVDSLFVLGHGGGRVGKAEGLETAIAEELEKNNYSTRQQIADMILEKHGVSMSVSAVGKLLKKTALGG